jgi:hypothetical protein
MRARLAGLVCLPLAALLASCGLVVSFSDYDKSAAHHRVTGMVDGLDGATVTLVVNGAKPGTVVSDGSFATDAVFEAGSPFVVTVAGVPEGHACHVESGTGTITNADAVGVVVHCPSTNAALASLSTSIGALAPGFSPAVLDYAAGPLRTPLIAPAATTTITATTAQRDARITVRGAAASSGVPTAPIALHLGSNLIDVVVTPAAEASPLHYSVVVQGTGVDFLKSPAPMASAGFGQAIAISASTVAIGEEQEGTVMAGNVFLHTRTGSSWSPPVTIAGPPSASGFGGAIAIDGDTFVTGAFNETIGAASVAGAAYVYVRTASGWEQQARLTAPVPRQNESFGTSVALAEDTIVIGASGDSSAATGVNPVHDDTDATRSGAVYVFGRVGTTWTQSAYLKPSNTQPGAFFGTSVALSGDTVVVGAPLESSSAVGVDCSVPGCRASTPGGKGAGAAYVFARSAGTWSQRSYVKASNARAGAAFGQSVAISNGAIVVGSPGESSAARGVGGNAADTTAASAGALYVFAPSGPSYTQRAYVKASNARSGSGFGAAVALAGDLLVVGAPNESSGATFVDGDQADMSKPGAGAVYLFSLATSITQRAYVKPAETRSASSFGQSVAVSSTLLLVGAPQDGSSAKGINGTGPITLPSSGAVHAFE